MSIQIENCDACGKYYEELIMARLILVSGQVVDQYLCEECNSKIKKYTDKKDYCHVNK